MVKIRIIFKENPFLRLIPHKVKVAPRRPRRSSRPSMGNARPLVSGQDVHGRAVGCGRLGRPNEDEFGGIGFRVVFVLVHVACATWIGGIGVERRVGWVEGKGCARIWLGDEVHGVSTGDQKTFGKSRVVAWIGVRGGVVVPCAVLTRLHVPRMVGASTRDLGSSRLNRGEQR